MASFQGKHERPVEKHSGTELGLKHMPAHDHHHGTEGHDGKAGSFDTSLDE